MNNYIYTEDDSKMGELYESRIKSDRVKFPFEPMSTDVYFKLTKEERLNFIRGRLISNGKRLRFNMSGGNPHNVNGECAYENNSILLRFSDLIFDKVGYVAFTTYKGNCCFVIHKWDGGQCTDGYGASEPIHVYDLGGYSTSEVIALIIEKCNDSSVIEDRSVCL